MQKKEITALIHQIYGTVKMENEKMTITLNNAEIDKNFIGIKMIKK